MASWLVWLPPDQVIWVRALARDIVLGFWARHFTPTVSLSTQVYKRLPANVMLGVTKIPSMGELLYATETIDKHPPDGQLSSFSRLQPSGFLLSFESPVSLVLHTQSKLFTLWLNFMGYSPQLHVQPCPTPYLAHLTQFMWAFREYWNFWRWTVHTCWSYTYMKWIIVINISPSFLDFLYLPWSAYEMKFSPTFLF